MTKARKDGIGAALKKPVFADKSKLDKPSQDDAIDKFIKGSDLAPDIELVEVQVAFPLRMPKSLRFRLKKAAAAIEDKTTMNELVNRAIIAFLDGLQAED